MLVGHDDDDGDDDVGEQRVAHPHPHRAPDHHH